MSGPPKDKSATRSARAEGRDRTSTVVATSLVGLSLLGAATIFWEPLTAFALGAPATEGVNDPRPELHPASPSPGGAAPSLAPASTPDDAGSAAAGPPDASGNS